MCHISYVTKLLVSTCLKINDHKSQYYMYPVSHPIEPRDFVMFPFMTCDCLLVWLGLAFESSTLGHFSEKPRGLTGWESGYIGREFLLLLLYW